MATSNEIILGAPAVRSQVIPTWQPAFFAELEQTGNLSASCRAANIRMDAVAHRRQRDPEFAKRVLDLLRRHKLTRDPTDLLVEAGRAPVWDEPWAEDEDLTVEQAFLATLGATLNASEACRRVGVPYSSYQSRRRDPEFARLVSMAIGRACDELEGALYRRALEESDPAAVAMLRAYRPDVYRTDARAPGDNPLQPSLEEAMRRGFEKRKLP